MLADLTRKLLRRQDLTQAEAEASLAETVKAESSDAAIASFLTALTIKGESADEVAGFARGMRRLARRIRCSRSPLLDTAGTGGGRETFNVSTTAAFVIAGAGVAVAKHGNRAVTSRSGSADVLEELGIDIDVASERASHCLEELGIGFLFAPHFHPAMKRVASIRRELSHRTIFNMAGPLTNPAGAPFQLIGVWEAGLTRTLAQAFSHLRGKRAWVVHSRDGMDELSGGAPSWVCEATTGSTRSFELDPKELELGSLEGDLSGGSPSHNAAVSLGVLGGEIQDIRRAVVILNAAAGLVLCLDIPIQEGVERARESIESGKAYQRLQQLVQMTSHA